MKNIFLVFVVLTIAFSACKSSKNISSAYQPPVNVAQEMEEKPEEIALNEVVTQAPVLMRTEGITFYNPNLNNGDYFSYYVVIGSFLNESNATSLNDALILKGFDPIVLKSESGYYRVAIKGTNEYKEATSLVYKIRATSPEHSDAWLLKRK